MYGYIAGTIKYLRNVLESLPDDFTNDVGKQAIAALLVYALGNDIYDRQCVTTAINYRM